MENINLNILGTVDIQKLDNSLLVIAKKKIIVPENNMIIPPYFEPPVRSLRASIPAQQS